LEKVQARTRSNIAIEKKIPVRVNPRIPHGRPKNAERIDMAQQNEEQKNAERQVTDELANQPKQEDGSAKEDESKEKRAQAEKELQDAK